MAPHSEPLIVGVAAAAAGFGVLVWLVERRKGDRHAGLAVLLGVPGVYLGFLVSLGATKWLYVPAITLIVMGTLVQIRIPPSRSRQDPAHPALDDDGSGGK